MKTARTFCRLAAIFAVVGFAACGESPSSPLAPAETASMALAGDFEVVVQSSAVQNTVTSAVIGPAGGTLTLNGGHSLFFPAGALAAPTTITAVSDTHLISVDFGPSGLTFPSNARPTLSYSYVNLGLLVNPYELSIVYMENGQAVEVLPTTVDVDARVVRADLDHFSTYALATD